MGVKYMSRIDTGIWARFSCLAPFLSGIKPNYENYLSTDQKSPCEQVSEIYRMAIIMLENIDRITFEEPEVFEQLMGFVNELKYIERVMRDLREHVERAAHAGRERYATRRHDGQKTWETTDDSLA